MPEQHFQELNYYEEVYPDDGFEEWDSVLGLSWERDSWMDDPRSPNTLPSPFKTIVESEVLDANVFSLQLPRNDSDGGEIVFGGSNEDLFEQESMAHHPFYPKNTTQWQVEVSGVTLAKAGLPLDAERIIEILFCTPHYSLPAPRLSPIPRR